MPDSRSLRKRTWVSAPPSLRASCGSVPQTVTCKVGLVPPNQIQAQAPGDLGQVLAFCSFNSEVRGPGSLLQGKLLLGGPAAGACGSRVLEEGTGHRQSSQAARHTVHAQSMSVPLPLRDSNVCDFTGIRPRARGAGLQVKLLGGRLGPQPAAHMAEGQALSPGLRAHYFLRPVTARSVCCPPPQVGRLRQGGANCQAQAPTVSQS